MRQTTPSTLEVSKSKHFAPESRDTRIAKALMALTATPTLVLNRDEWKDAAENPELEDEQ